MKKKIFKNANFIYKPLKIFVVMKLHEKKKYNDWKI